MTKIVTKQIKTEPQPQRETERYFTFGSSHYRELPNGGYVGGNVIMRVVAVSPRDTVFRSEIGNQFCTDISAEDAKEYYNRYSPKVYDWNFQRFLSNREARDIIFGKSF